jgi:hypothetical protein
MTKTIDQPKDMEMMQIEELAYSNMIQHEALIRLMIRKGIVTKKDYLDEVGIVTKVMKNKKKNKKKDYILPAGAEKTHHWKE